MSDREDLEPMVAEMIRGAVGDNLESRCTMKFLADLLRMDRLPKSGRDYVAAALENMANGIEPFPKKSKTRSLNRMEILRAVEGEIGKRRAAHGELGEIYEAVGRRFNIKGTVVAKYASEARAHIARTIDRHVAAGQDADRVINLAAKAANLHVDRVKSYFLSPRLKGKKPRPRFRTPLHASAHRRFGNGAEILPQGSRARD